MMSEENDVCAHNRVPISHREENGVIFRKIDVTGDHEPRARNTNIALKKKITCEN